MKLSYLKTNEREEAVRSLEWAAVQIRLVEADPYVWKWVIISLHNAVQGFMVLALWNGNGLLAMRDDKATKWLDAYAKNKALPADFLDNFPNLYEKAKNPANFHIIGAGPFVSAGSHDFSIAKLNEIRNQFIHFTPKGWKLQLAGLPAICLDVLDVVQFFGWESTSILWSELTEQARAKAAVADLNHVLNALDVAAASSE